MKQQTVRRLLAMLLTLAMVLPLSPAAFAEDGDGAAPLALTIEGATSSLAVFDNTTTPPSLTLYGTEQGSNSFQVAAIFSSSGHEADTVGWVSSNPSVATVGVSGSGSNSHSCTIVGLKPGETTVTASAEGATSATLKVVVSGIELTGSKFKTDSTGTSVTVLENGSQTLTKGTDLKFYGFAETATAPTGNGTVTVRASKNGIISDLSYDKTAGALTFKGVKEGTTEVTFTVSDGSHSWTTSFYVTVEENPAQTIEVSGSYSVNKPLKLSAVESEMASRCVEMLGSGNTLASVTGLKVDTKQGTLYLNYKSAADTGSGVGSALYYMVASAERGPYIKDITFVPNPTFTGAQAEIEFVGNGSGGGTFKGKIVVNLAEATADISYTASLESPAQFDGNDFAQVCQLQTGAPLSYVVFTLPTESQGILYEGYVTDTDYSAKVSSTTEYNQTDINKLSFVPTQGYMGLAAIGYTGYSVSGLRYTGEVRITVTQSLNDSIFYYDGGTGEVTFSGSDFSEYCSNATGGRLSFVRFTPPASSQGIFYRTWNGSSGTPVTAGDQFSVSAIDRATFVAAEGFHGTVRIPFTGENSNGVEFNGTVEITIQTDSNSSITYTCTPGGSVKLSSNDFNDMSLRLTGQRLHYITFQNLPDYSSGAFYHNRTSAGGMGESVSREARYYNSASPYIMNLSFWASSSFYGSIEVPFTGCAVSGDTFSGMLVITSASSSVGSGSTTVSYTSVGRAAVVFRGEDFDRISRSATNSGLNYVRFTPPSTSIGMMYFDYNPTIAPSTVSSTDNLYLSGDASISKVSFLPSYSYSGTVSIPFSGWAISGAQFQGTVVINVQAEATNTTIRYSTHGEPITFTSYDFRNAGGDQPVIIRIDALPGSYTGRLYYQYTNPTKYSWPVAAGTEYQINGIPLVSDLTFMPKAGYSGTAEIPYTGTNTDGSTFSGSILVTISQTSTSEYFKDMEDCDVETVTAVDFLYTQGVTNGVDPTHFAPKSPIKRGDFCLMIYRAFQFELNGSAALFQDVPDGMYYAQAIRVLRSMEIVKGTGYDLFSPEAYISRQDAALIIQRTLRAAGLNASDGSPDVLSRYSDGDTASAYAQGALACIVQQGLQPSSWLVLQPKNNLTRAEMAVLLHRAITI